MKRTLKRELKVPEITDREADRSSSAKKISGYERGNFFHTARVKGT